MPEYKNPELRNIREGVFEPISWGEFQKFLEVAYDREHKALLVFAYVTGIRPSELGIVKEEIYKEGVWLKTAIRTTKRGVRRILYLPLCNKEMEELWLWIKEKTFPKEYIFPSFVRVRNPREKFMHLNEKCGIGRWVEGKFYPLSFYLLRHNILTLLAQNGANFLELQMFKGAKLDERIWGTVAPYVHVSQDLGKRIGRILKKILKTENLKNSE